MTDEELNAKDPEQLRTEVRRLRSLLTWCHDMSSDLTVHDRIAAELPEVCESTERRHGKDDD